MTTKKEKQQGGWVYEYDKKYPCKYESATTGKVEITEITEVRYVLGEIFDSEKPKALVCIGINPSTAIPECLDPTLNKVRKYAKENGYGAWYMLNIYPQRSTDPDGMDAGFNKEIHVKNITHIQELMNRLPSADIWCAWGGSITKRDYLKTCLKGIIDCIGYNKPSFKYVQSIAENKEQPQHPVHPIASIKVKEKLEKFEEIEKYLKTNLKV